MRLLSGLMDLLFVALVTALAWFLLAMLFPHHVPQIPVSFAANELQVGFGQSVLGERLAIHAVQRAAITPGMPAEPASESSGE